MLDAKTGDVLALAGLAYSAPQPPGLDLQDHHGDGCARRRDRQDLRRRSRSSRRTPRSAARSPTRTTSSAAAPSRRASPSRATRSSRRSARELGGPKLVETAELYGFNAPPTLYDQATTAVVDPPQSTIPEAISESVETGESAIGQGEVLRRRWRWRRCRRRSPTRASRLPNAIARDPPSQPPDDPVKVDLAADRGDDAPADDRASSTRAPASPRRCRGSRSPARPGPRSSGPSALEPGQQLGPGEAPPQDTDAWFTAFAPASDPKIAVAVMVVNADGDGGTVAAPIVRQVMASYFGVA